MAFIENTITFTVLFPVLSFATGFVSQFFINRRFFAFMGATLAALLITGVVQMLKTAALDVWAGSMITTVLFADAVVAAARRAGVFSAGGVDRVKPAESGRTDQKGLFNASQTCKAGQGRRDDSGNIDTADCVRLRTL